MTAPTAEDSRALLERLTGYTPRPWCVGIDDDGNPLSGRPGVFASDELDCAIVHWDGFVQEYWRSARGDKEIHANARLIAAAPDLVNHLRASLHREAELQVERDAAVEWAEKAEAERDAALAQYGGLSVAHQKVIATANEQFHRANKLQAELDEARAEADRLREVLYQSSPAFTAWFGNSKVVDENGEPQVVYHGTASGPIDVFATDDGTAEGAAFFSVDPEVAQTFSDAAYEAGAEGEQAVLAVYLRVVNPMVVTAAEVMDEEHGQLWHSFARMTAAVEKAKAAGHDGLLLKAIPDGGKVADQWAVFAPEQIKSIPEPGA